METTEKNAKNVQGTDTAKVKQPTVALKMLGTKAKELLEMGLIDQDDLTVLQEIHKKAVLKHMGG